jgi:hypothetical protein
MQARSVPSSGTGSILESFLRGLLESVLSVYSKTTLEFVFKSSRERL